MKRPSAYLRAFDREAGWRSAPHRFWFYFCAVCLSLYLSYALYLSRSAIFTSAWATALSLLWFLLFALGLFAGLLLGCRAGRAPAPAPQRRRLDPRVFWGATALALVVLGCNLARCYPGGLSTDAAKQWAQVQSGQYDNWHPVFHTLLMWLGTRLFNSYPFLVAQQLAALSLALGYVVATLHAWGAKAWALLIAELALVASSLFGNAAMHVWKDDALTLGALALFAQAVNAWFSDGEWLKKPRNAVALGLTLAFTTMVRHNGFLFTVPLLVSLLLCYRPARRRLLLAAGVAAACVALVWGPVYALVGVTYPDSTFEESVGVPMTVLCDARVKNPDALDGEARALLDALADDEEWATLYREGSFNSIKFNDWENRWHVLAKEIQPDFWRMALSTVRADPRTAFEAVNAVTGLVWDVRGDRATVSLRGTSELGGYRYADTRLNRLGETLTGLFDAPSRFAPIAWYTQNIGVSFALMLLCALRALYRCGPRALTLCVPTLLYNLGTMCLLCGNDARFFQYSLALCTFALLALPRAPGLPKSDAL